MVTCCFAVLVSLFLWWQHLKFALRKMKVKVLVPQSCLIPCNLMDCVWPTSLLFPCNSPGKNTGVGSHSLLQGIFQHRDGYWVSCIACRFFTRWTQVDAVWWSCWSSCRGLLHSEDVHPGALSFCIILMVWSLGSFLSILSLGFSLISYFREIYY